MQADAILKNSRHDPFVIVASFGANLLSLAIPMAMIHIYDRVIPNQGYETLAALGIMVAGAIFAEAILRACRRKLLELSAERFETIAYPSAIEAILRADPVENRASQGHLFRCVTSIDRLRNLHVGQGALDPLDLPFALLFLGVVALLSPMLALAMFILLSVAFLILRHARRGVLLHQIRRKDNEEKRHSFLSEILRGIDFIKTKRIESFMLRRYERLLGGAATISAEAARSIQRAQGFTAAIGTLSPLFVGSIGAIMVIDGTLTVGSLAAIVLLTGRIIQPVLRMEAYLAGADNIRQHHQDFCSMMALTPRPDGPLQLDRIDSLSLNSIDTKCDFGLGVRFSGLDFTFRRGDCVAIVGATRESRRLFLRLLAGELGIERGEFSLNGEPADSYSLEDRLKRIRLLSSENRLIEGSLLDNLTAFQPHLYRDRAVQLARSMGIEDAISRSSEGYSLKVGVTARTGIPQSLSDAVTIIGGLVTQPDVLLFDEANGALDREADACLLQLLGDLAPECIIFMVSNRPSFLKMANKTLDLGPFVDFDEKSEAAVQ